MLGRLVIRLTVAAALVGAVTLSAHVSGAADDRTVSVKDFQFDAGPPDPNLLTVQVGDKVVWQVLEGTHTVTPDVDGAFIGSGPLNQNDTYELTFDTPGDYAYHCEIHKDTNPMSGIIRVAAPPTTEPPTTTTTEPPTTTTTRPPTTTTTVRVTTTTTAPPATTPTTSPPAPGTTTPPPTVAAAGPFPTTPTTARPAPTTTTTKKKSGKSATTTTSRARKGDEKAGAPADQPPAAPGEQPPAETPAGDFPRLGSGEVPTSEPGTENPASETGSDEQAAPIAKREKALDRNGTRLLLGTAIVVILLGLGVLGYKWRTRDSQYWAA